MYGWITERVVDYPPGFVYFIVLFLKENITLRVDEVIGPPRLCGLKHECGYAAGPRRDTFDFFDVIGDGAFVRHDVVFEDLSVGSPVEGIFAVDREKVVRPFGPLAVESVDFISVHKGRIFFIEIVFIGDEIIAGSGVEEVFHSVPHNVVSRRYRIDLYRFARTGEGVGAENTYLLVGRGGCHDVAIGEQLGRVRVCASIGIEHDFLVGNAD